jgi:hypothetical protein
MVGTELSWKACRQRTHSTRRRRNALAAEPNCFDRKYKTRTLPRTFGLPRIVDAKSSVSAQKAKNRQKLSACGRRTVLQARRICEKIIGHTRTIFARSIWCRRRGLAPLMLDKPSGDHCRSKFLYPLIQDGAGFLSEICRMSETRKLVTLQRIARSGKQEFPRGTDVVSGHVIFS